MRSQESCQCLVRFRYATSAVALFKQDDLLIESRFSSLFIGVSCA
jgi:hypothetical protein